MKLFKYLIISILLVGTNFAYAWPPTPPIISENYLQAAQNLGDVASASTSATNLGLGTGDSPTFAGASFTDVLDFDDPTTFTTTLTGFHAANQTQNGDITSLPGDNVMVRRLRVYISTDPTASENVQFRLSFYSGDGYTEDELLWSDFFNLTYSEVLNAQWNDTDTSGDIDTSAGLTTYDLIRCLGGTPENVRVTAITDSDTIAFTALAEDHAVDTGVVRVYEYTDAFMLFDDDDSAEIHVQLESLATLTASTSIVIEVDIQ